MDFFKSILDAFEHVKCGGTYKQPTLTNSRTRKVDKNNFCAFLGNSAYFWRNKNSEITRAKLVFFDNFYNFSQTL